MTSDPNYSPYVVCQGDHLQKIAFAFGLEPKKLWHDPKNADLKALRGNGEILQPGDVLHVPKQKSAGRPVRARTTNRYRARIPTMRVDVTIGDPAEPFADEPYEVRGLMRCEGEPPPAGTTDGDGRVSLDLPIDIRVIEVFLSRRKTPWGKTPACRPGNLPRKIPTGSFCRSSLTSASPRRPRSTSMAFAPPTRISKRSTRSSSELAPSPRSMDGTTSTEAKSAGSSTTSTVSGWRSTPTECGPG